ncbi:DUF4262 domain-containing protein [Sphingobacterium detergens]|uniref:DUF4262 domain-containing protein n=1 Tax=Sphingobacterium detergens TaxID=1145106 RepID=UPI003AAFA21D
MGLAKTYLPPELICIRLSKELAHKVINDITVLIKHCERIESNKLHPNVFEGSQAIFLKVDPRNMESFFKLTTQQILNYLHR